MNDDIFERETKILDNNQTLSSRISNISRNKLQIGVYVGAGASMGAAVGGPIGAAMGGAIFLGANLIYYYCFNHE
ncbi:MAG: hypothetical protein J7L08_00130 [Candidatus Aenigmarchaeota archaeon]|nr:hypothetical protein [Candidatus Aenigmarchaeota archaeon]